MASVGYSLLPAFVPLIPDLGFVAELFSRRRNDREGVPMPFKPNYRLQRADRQRAKEEKQQKKLLRRADRNAKEQADTPDALGDPASDGDMGTPELPR